MTHPQPLHADLGLELEFLGSSPGFSPSDQLVLPLVSPINSFYLPTLKIKINIPMGY